MAVIYSCDRCKRKVSQDALELVTHHAHSASNAYKWALASLCDGCMSALKKFLKVKGEL